MFILFWNSNKSQHNLDNKPLCSHIWNIHVNKEPLEMGKTAVPSKNTLTNLNLNLKELRFCLSKLESWCSSACLG